MTCFKFASSQSIEESEIVKLHEQEVESLSIPLIGPQVGQLITEQIELQNKSNHASDSEIDLKKNVNEIHDLPKIYHGEIDSFFFNYFSMGIIPSVIFTLPGIINFKITPRIEIGWSRKFPKNYKFYNPN